ncbi:MAG: hypothetical protein L3J98_01490 [Gammaproteobacteria bacterium]|nr:hypothetical protein [Gammaproteobacteria bacterium]MCF6258829.1 hypothetical protein [Gammaproteobacteria bacterium]
MKNIKIVFFIKASHKSETESYSGSRRFNIIEGNISNATNLMNRDIENVNISKIDDDKYNLSIAFVDDITKNDAFLFLVELASF